MEQKHCNKYGFDDLIAIMQTLRSEQGCPWDREQTHQSIRKNFLEETCEVLEAIDNEDPDSLKEELGDVLLQVVFHAQMEAEKGRFTIDDVANDICTKLIVRHPHIFADVVANDAEQVLQNWEAIKKAGKGYTNEAQHLEAVPKTLPALMRAVKVGQRASKAGMDYADLLQTITDLETEIAELKEAIAVGSKAHIEEELGDVLLSITNTARFLNLDPEQALSKATDKFIGRFSAVEALAKRDGSALAALSPAQMEAYWQTAKQMEVYS